MADHNPLDPLVHYIRQRTRLQITQRDLCDIIGITPATYRTRRRDGYKSGDLVDVALHFYDDHGITVEEILIHFGKATREQMRGTADTNAIADVMREVLDEYLRPIEDD